MSKRTFTFMAGLLLAFTLALTACGAPAEAPKDEAGQQAETTQAAPADPKEKFVGTWQTAKADMNGVSLAGDFTPMFGSGDGEKATMFVLAIAADGTGSIAFEGDEQPLTWELKDDNTIAITASGGEAEEIGAIKDTPVVYDAQEQSLFLSLEFEDSKADITFTADGTLASIPDYDMSKATAVTSVDQIVGDWKLTGVSMMGMVAYGAPEQLSEQFGDVYDANFSIAADGTATTTSGDMQLTVNADGATLGESGLSVPVKLLGENLVLDMSELMGGSEMAMVYTK